MVFIVTATGSTGALAIVEADISQLANGWRRLAPNVWIVVSYHESEVIRDQVGGQTQVTVMRVDSNWASRGNPKLTSWLQSASEFF